MNRILFAGIFATLGALIYGWYYNNQHIHDVEQEKLQAFVSAGPRYTAQQGYSLCMTVREIAKHSIGFKESGLPLPECGPVNSEGKNE